MRISAYLVGAASVIFGVISTEPNAIMFGAVMFGLYWVLPGATPKKTRKELDNEFVLGPPLPPTGPPEIDWVLFENNVNQALGYNPWKEIDLSSILKRSHLGDGCQKCHGKGCFAPGVCDPRVVCKHPYSEVEFVDVNQIHGQMCICTDCGAHAQLVGGEWEWPGTHVRRRSSYLDVPVAGDETCNVNCSDCGGTGVIDDGENYPPCYCTDVLVVYPPGSRQNPSQSEMR